MKNIYSTLTVYSVFFLFAICSLNAQITSYPYIEDFNSGTAGWTVGGDIYSWEWNSNGLWETNINSYYLYNENGWIQSPVFDLSNLSTPHVQLNIKTRINSSDGAILQSSIDSGVSWQVIGLVDEDVNWYNSSSISSNPGGQSQGWSWSSNTKYFTAIHSLSNLMSQTNVIFRIVFASDEASNWFGVELSDFFILDNPCYAGEIIM